MNDLVHALMEARRQNLQPRRNAYAAQNSVTPFQARVHQALPTQNIDPGSMEFPLDPWGTSPEGRSEGAGEVDRNATDRIFENQQTDNVPPSDGLSEDQRRKLEGYQNRFDFRKESARQLQAETIEGIVRDMEKNNDIFAPKARTCQARSPENGAQFLECLFDLDGIHI